MLRAFANNLSKTSSSSSQPACNAALKQSEKSMISKAVRIYFSTSTGSQQSVESSASNEEASTSTKTFEEKQAFFNRFSNAYFGGDQIEERSALYKQLKAANFSRDLIEERLTKELKEIYGKNYEKVLNKRFSYEIFGHRNGVATGELELYPKNVQAQGKFNTISSNADLVNELHASNYLNLNEAETQTHVVPTDSHFSLLLDEYIPDEYVQDLDDNQACLFGFAKSLDESDIIALLKQNNVNYTAITFGECVFSLPAYAVLTFNSASEANEFNRTFNAASHTIDRRTIYSTTFQDSRSEHGRNRTLLVSGFSNDESVNELVNFLSVMGSVMHFEIVEEPVHEALPTTEQVLEFLKKTVKPGDESIIYEITDTSTTSPKIIEYPPFNPNQTFLRDAKKVSELELELEVEKLRSQELAKRELLPRLVLNTWDSELNAPAEYKLQNKSAEQRKLIEAVQNDLRHEFKNKKYLFVTYASRQETEIAHEMLNSTGVYQTVLKKSSEHYHSDTAHQTSVFKEIKESKHESKGVQSDSSLLAKEQDGILAESHEEMRRNLIDATNSGEFTQELSKLLESEVIGKSKHGFEHQIHLKNENAIGREFSTRITSNDLNKVATQLQAKQRENVRSLESLSKNEDAMLDLYRAKVMNADFNKATHPYNAVSESAKSEILGNVQDQAMTEYKQRQLDYLIEEQAKQRWVDNTREIIENKLAALQRDSPSQRRSFDRKSNNNNNNTPADSEPKEKEQKDQYYALSSEFSINKRQNKYLRYVSEMQSLYDGEYTESMKDRIFRQGGQKCTDVDGKVFVSEEKGKAIQEQVLTASQKADIAYYHSIYDVLPRKKIADVMNQFKTAPDETIYMMSKLNLPTKVFDRSAVAESADVNSNYTNEELADQLNKYVAGLGEVYEVQKDARGEEKIVMYSNEPHPVPLNALNIDEIAMLRDCLTTYGLNAEQTEKEIQYFLKNGSYSEEVEKLMGSIQVEPEAEMEALINSTGLSKAQLESILNLDFSKNGQEIVESLSRQKEEAAFMIKMGPTKPEDLIKTKTKLRNKDNTGKYKTSGFKVF